MAQGAGYKKAFNIYLSLLKTFFKGSGYNGLFCQQAFCFLIDGRNILIFQARHEAAL
jgi:hypothetical protein